MKVGQYVRCPIVFEANDKIFPRNFVLGKIISVNELSEEVDVKLFDLRKSKQFFEHAFQEKRFPIEKVSRCRAAKNAPVLTPRGAGKIISVSNKNDEDAFYKYYIVLNSGQLFSFLENELKIEYTAADYEPIKQMMQYEFQNPTWYANRLQVSSNMHMVNNTVYGFKELIGCRTFLMAHQISTVVRAFESMPIRYLLADEVGLGKTIEACSIVKILSSENPDLKVLYIVPGALAQQWENELKYKFGLTATQEPALAFYTKHVIITLESLNEGNDIVFLSWDLLIVDETHRLLVKNEKFNIVYRLSKQIKNVLFLSATPIQNRKQEYLRLLSLLQPEQYGCMSVEKFSSILGKQKMIQRRVNLLISRMKQYAEYKEDLFEKLSELAEELEDKALLTIVRGIKLDSLDMGQAAMEQSLSYISENYRIERNIIRNRREYISETLGRRVLKEIPYVMKNADDNYCERNTYFALLEYLSSSIQGGSIEIKNVFKLLHSFFSSPWALLNVFCELGIEDDGILTNLKLWLSQADDELKQIDYCLDDNTDSIKGRLMHALDFVEQEVTVSGDNNGKVVVFSEFPETLLKFGNMLEKRDISCVYFMYNMSKEDLEDNVYQFQNNEKCRFILCDSTGGEGRNFQNADWIVHLDLPWTANAIEQRIGRLDRLGRDKDHLTVTSVVLYSNNSIEEQLFKLWNEGLDLFKRSLSGLEIITDELNNRIEEALEDDIYNGLENALEDIIDMTEDTRDAVEEEQLYDSGSIIYRPLSIAVKQMLQTYSCGENDLFQSSMLGWAYQAGLSSRVKEDIVHFSSQFFSPKAATQSLFVPPDWDLYKDSAIVRKEGKILGTFNRAVAIKREDLLFYAPGDPVFESIIGNAIGSGRGRCCAFISTAPFNYKGFVCIYNIDPNIDYLIENNVSVKLLSQFRMYLPMEQIVVFISLDKNERVTDRELREYLHDKRNLVNAVHLGKRTGKNGRLSPLDSFMHNYPKVVWEKFVNKVSVASKSTAEKQVNEKADFESAKREIDRIVSGYESEYLYLGKDMEKVKEIKKRYEAVYYALSHPVLTLDSISLMILKRH